MLGGPLCGSALNAEDARHDHIESDGLHLRGKSERAANRPVVQFSFGDVTNHLRVTLDRLTVERRQQQLALTQMTRPVRGQHRVWPHDRAQRRLSGQRGHQLGLGGKQGADMVGVTRQHDPAGNHHEANLEHVTELASRGEYELDLPLGEAQSLQGSR